MTITRVFFICIFLILLAFSLSSQSTIIDIPDIDAKGIIFDENVEIGYAISNFQGRFLPSMEDVILAENLLSIFDYPSRKVLRKGYRQYIGYIANDDRYLMIHVMKYKSKRHFKKHWSGWDSDFGIYFGEPDAEQLSYLYHVNLTEKMIGF